MYGAGFFPHGFSDREHKVSAPLPPIPIPKGKDRLNLGGTQCDIEKGLFNCWAPTCPPIHYLSSLSLVIFLENN